MTGLPWKMDFEERVGSYSLLCGNQTFYVGNPMLMKTLSWRVAGVEIHSVQFPGFLTLSRCLFFSLSTKISSDGADYTLYPTWQPPLYIFPVCWSPLLILIPLYQHQTSSTNVQRLLTVCFQLPCHHLIPLFSVYSRIWVRKYILGWLILPHLISAAGWWLPAVLCSIFVWRAIFENKLCRWYKSDG